MNLRRKTGCRRFKRLRNILSGNESKVIIQGVKKDARVVFMEITRIKIVVRKIYILIYIRDSNIFERVGKSSEGRLGSDLNENCRYKDRC